MSQSTVYSITQDALGFMWIGTQDGLNRYDGKSFKVYRPSKSDPGSVQSYYIRCLTADSKGRLWAGGNEGISLYDYRTDKFTNYKLKSKPGEWFVSSIIEGESPDVIWAAGNGGEIFRLNAGAKNFELLDDLPLQDHGITVVYSLGLLGSKLLLGTGRGVFLLDPLTKILTPVNTGLNDQRINVIFPDGPYFWIGSEGGGLCRLDSRNFQYTHYRRQNLRPGLINDEVRGIAKDEEGNIWIGTFRGLSILNPATGLFQNYYHQSHVQSSISQNSVRCIYRDRQMGMWLGTFYGGISYFHKNEISFNLLSQASGTPALNDEVVNVIRQDKKGGFWIGTNDKGLNYWQPAEGRISYFTPADNLSSNNIKSIAFADNGDVLLGMHDAGLNVLNPQTRQVAVYRHTPGRAGGISGNMVYALLKDHAGRVWVGTRTGLDRFYPSEKSFTAITADKSGKRFTSNEITSLMEDSRHRIWVGTINGVNIFYPDNMVIEALPRTSLSSDVVNFIAEDKDKRIWVGTRDGLNLFDEDNKTFISYHQRGDFPKGNINAMLYDTTGDLWITTNANLIRYNPVTTKSQYFDANDGLQNRQFNVAASCYGADGMVLFGGIDGITYFYPHTLRQPSLKLQIAFTGLEVFNRPVIPGDESGILQKHVDQSAVLQFNHEQRQFSIQFNTFNYISTNRTRYLYKLDGFDKEWQQTNGAPRAVYSNLQPGEYKFHVKAVGPQGESSPERTLGIIVTPVWYKSTWFYILLAVVVAGTAFFLYRILTERMRALHQLKLERVQREKVSYINQVKTDFFTNVSHELRTPLTLIMAPLEEMTQKPVADKKIRRNHELMLTNTKRLYQLVNQLFEFRKAEMGTRKLRVSKGDLVRFVRDVFASFKPLADKNNIHYSFETALEKLDVYFDRDALENILYNLLSNAFKYTAQGNSIQVRLLVPENMAELHVNDTGKGIAAEHLNRIFDRFYQVEGQEMNLGSGVGLAFTKKLVELHHGNISVKSKPGEGTDFMMTFPLDDAMYASDAHVDAAIPEMPAPADEAVPPLPMDDDSSGGEEKPVETLLIVDDNTDIVNYLKEYFSGKYHVAEAHNGKEALKLLELSQPDLIISDVMMPEMNGLHFCKRVKQNVQTSHIPVILLTARTETTQQISGLEMGADDYITKPFSVALLEAKIHTILRTRSRLREYYANAKEIEPEKITFNTVDEEFLKKAMQLVEENLDEYDFSVDKLSRGLGMSRSNLYLKIKAITGESVTAFINRIRFKKAVELLQSRKYTIAEIAYMCGFNTPSYFSTAFKRHYGCMPTEYLQQPGKE